MLFIPILLLCSSIATIQSINIYYFSKLLKLTNKAKNTKINIIKNIYRDEEELPLNKKLKIPELDSFD